MDSKDICLLKLFSLHCKHLCNNSLIVKGLLSKITIRGNFDLAKGVITVYRRHVDEEALESLLVRLRKFNNKDDAIYLPRILKILLRCETNTEVIKSLREVKKLFQGKGKHKKLRYQYQGKDFTEENMFDLYINGRIFHADSKKHEELIKINDILSWDYDMFLKAVIDKVNAVFITYRYVIENKLLDKGD